MHREAIPNMRVMKRMKRPFVDFLTSLPSGVGISFVVFVHLFDIDFSRTLRLGLVMQKLM